MSQGQFQMSVPVTPVVKKLIIVNLIAWVGGILILQNLVLRNDLVVDLFGLVPYHVLHSFWVWQFATYMFLHSPNVFHVLFNMLSLWWFGAELEQRWGARFFFTYYMICGVGAGVLYWMGTVIYGLVSGNPLPMEIPLVGASGAVYGLLLAYGLLFGERQIFFMMLFPMKAKYFTMIIGAVELTTLLGQGLNSDVANLAHLGGLLVGLVTLTVVAHYRARAGKASSSSKRGRRLKLVVDNERNQPEEKQSGPKYWN